MRGSNPKTLDGYAYRIPKRPRKGDGWYSLTTEERSARMKRIIAKHGLVGGKHPLWTAEEDAMMRELWPDRDLFVKRLKRRTRRAVGSRGIALGLAGKNHSWTDAEVLLLRKLYPRCSAADLRTTFHGLSWEAIKQKAAQHCIYRPSFKTQWLKTDQRILNEIRARAKEFNYSVQDVLDLSGMKPKQKSIFHRQLRPTCNQLEAMVEALGGRIVVEWID